MEQVIVEKWTEGPLIQRPGATTTPAARATSPILRQKITVDLTKDAKEVAPNDPLRENIESYILTGVDLEMRLEFELLFLRPPREGEGDVVITAEMFRELASQLWYH